MSREIMTQYDYVRWFEELKAGDVAVVGGKNASLGEMFTRLTGEGIRVPRGFALTADAYRRFLRENGLEAPIAGALASIGKRPLEAVGAEIRARFDGAEFPEEIAGEIRRAYRELGGGDVAVRSSATAEDLPEASFAGQQETFLNVRGEEALLEACRRCYASLFTDRAISYRIEKGFDHMKVALSAGVQRMVRSDRGAAGVMFTIDPESGFPRAAVIDGAWGLGETVVQGTVTPDEFVVFKPLLDTPGARPILSRALGGKEKKMVYAAPGAAERVRTVETTPEERALFVLDDDEVLRLARWGVAIERHYGRPMDIEWAKDEEGIFIVQARPETVQSRLGSAALKTYSLKGKGPVLAEGIAVGSAIAAGPACVIKSVRDIGRFRPGSILVTEMTDPDWGPVLKQAAGVVTDQGGRTCHAAIVSRELGIPAIVGTGNATAKIEDGQEVTLSCAEGEHARVYEGILEFEERDVDLRVPPTRTKVMLNVASPAAAFRWWRLPAEGVGLARMEFVINNLIKIHPMALVRFDTLEDAEAKRRIEELTRGYADKREYFTDKLSQGIAKIAAAQHPHPVIVRMSDFKTNEYANLIGGAAFEPKEENPMLGFRGASRYTSEEYREGFALECEAVRRVRDEMGLTNVVAMIPFCRRVDEADRVLAEMARNGLERGVNGLQVYVMCEIPSNVILAERFAERFDGFSIGSNDLTQLVLGVDRDSGRLAHLFDERDDAVRWMIEEVIRKARAAGRKVGICGQAPSDHPEFAEFLVRAGIDSISVIPDSVVRVKRAVAAAEGT